MRSGPAPALQDVLVARPGTTSTSTAVIRRDDLLAAATLATDDSRDPTRARPRSMFAAMSRRWARISESLRRRRSTSSAAAAQNAAAVAAAALAATEPRRAIEDRSEFAAAFDRERLQRGPPPREVRAVREGTLEEEMLVSSMRETSSRRVRQVGAREDDDTLLMLPRVASVSFSSPSSHREETSQKTTPRVRHLPRVSALMPVRGARPLEAVSPVSSDGSRESRGAERIREGGSEEVGERLQSSEDDTFSDGFASVDHGDFDEEFDDADDEGSETEKKMFHRLPTGLLSRDVEQAMEDAVLEIASDGGSDNESVLDSQSKKETAREYQGIDIQGFATRGAASNARSLSELPLESSRQVTDENEVVAAFTRRVSSSTHSSRQLFNVEEGEAQPVSLAEQKSRLAGHDCTLFEDDYLSFQGFHGSPNEPRSHYQSMTALLRTKRISSITDSHSENSDDGVDLRPINSMDTRRKQNRRIRPPILRMKPRAISDNGNHWHT